MNQKQLDLVHLALTNLGQEFGPNVEPVASQLKSDARLLRAFRIMLNARWLDNPAQSEGRWLMCYGWAEGDFAIGDTPELSIIAAAEILVARNPALEPT